MNLKLSAPKQITWLIAVIIGVIGILGQYNVISFGGSNNFLFVMIGFLILAVASLFKGI